MSQSQGSSLKVSQSVGGATQDVATILGLMSRMNTCELVQVISVDGDTIKVKPLLSKIDANGNAVARGEIDNVPFVRIQGGANALIIDPKPNDIGMCCFASRDISMVKRARGEATPNSKRQYDISDALYIGGMLNGTPSQYIKFNGGNIEVSTPSLSALKNVSVGNGATGSFSTATGQTVTVSNGIITGIS